jgi:hypothetical protein
MKQHRPAQRLLEQPGEGDPLVRAMRAALEEDPSSALLARLGAQVDAAIAEGRAPRFDDAPHGEGFGSQTAWLSGAGIAALLAAFASLALLHGGSQPAGQDAAARTGTRPSSATAAPSPSPQRQAAIESEPRGLAPSPPERLRERKPRGVEHAATLEPEDELELLRRAQQALPRDGRAALAFVQRHEQAYPHGLLEQERELLAIAALLALHDGDRAQRRAQAFRHTFPHSVHLRRLDRMLAQPVRSRNTRGNFPDAGTLTR